MTTTIESQTVDTVKGNSLVISEVRYDSQLKTAIVRSPQHFSEKTEYGIFYSGVAEPVLEAVHSEIYEVLEPEFLKIFEEIFTHVPVRDLYELFPLVKIKAIPNDTLTCLLDLHATDREKAHLLMALSFDKLFCFSKGSSPYFPVKVEKLLQLIRARFDLFNEAHSTVNDVLALIDPVNYQLGAELSQFLKAFAVDENDVELFKDEDYRNFFQLVYGAINQYGSNDEWVSPLRESSMLKIPSFSKNNLLAIERVKKLPLHHPEFREFMLTTSPHQLFNASSDIPLDSSPDIAIETAKMLMEEKNNNEKVYLCFDMYTAVFNSVKDLSNVAEVKSLYDEFISESSLPTFILEQYKEFFEKTELKIDTCSEALRILEIINCYKYAESFYLTDSRYRYPLIKRLSEKFGAVKAFEKILEVAETNTKLTFDQWMNYIDNYDDYCDAPTSWWVNLV